MNLIKFIVENTSSRSSKNNLDLGISVFDKVFRKLALEGNFPGKIMPIYIQNKNIQKVLGAVTLNRNGSFSFFPEFEGKLPFEHITVPKSFLKNKPHLTDVVDGTNKKIIPVTAQPISNGTYHIFSGLFEPEFLKDMPKEVVYKDLSINKYDCLQKAFSMEDGSFVGSIIMELPDLDIRNILLQIFIAPKGIEIKNILPFEDAFRKNKEINQKCLHDIADEVFLRLNGICHYTHDDFLVVFCIVVNDKPYKNDLKFFFPVERGGWYSKIENLKILPK